MNECGGVLSPVDLRDYKFNLDTSKLSLPESYSISMLHNIKNQRTVGSCTAHALASILEYHDQNQVTLSTNFIYGLKRKVCNHEPRGERIRDALTIARKYGDPRRSLCPGNNEVPKVYEQVEKLLDDENLLEDARQHKIFAYLKLQKDSDIKYALLNFGPVIACMKWYSGGEFNQQTHFVEFDETKPLTYHSILLYGWDSEGWLCQNSWGISWGRLGTFKVPFGKLEEAYAVVDDEELGTKFEQTIKQPVAGKALLESLFKLLNKLINFFLRR